MYQHILHTPGYDQGYTYRSLDNFLNILSAEHPFDIECVSVVPGPKGGIESYSILLSVPAEIPREAISRCQTLDDGGHW